MLEYEVWAMRTDDESEWCVVRHATKVEAINLANALSSCDHIEYALPIEVGI